MICTIFHIAEIADANAMIENNEYRAPSLDTEGFIHCAKAEQLPGVIQRYYAGATALTLLSLNADVLGETLVMENTVGGEELFPHVYAAIPLSAVVGTNTLDAEAIQALATLERYEPDQSNS